MTTHRLLFLLGGSAAFDSVAEAFVPAAGGCDSNIALLMQGGQEWEKHVPEYTHPWIQRGVSRYLPIVPDENGTLDVDAASAKLREERRASLSVEDTRRPTTVCMPQNLSAASSVSGITRVSPSQGCLLEP